MDEGVDEMTERKLGLEFLVLDEYWARLELMRLV